MSMVGRLEDLALPDILQILSLSKKTGKLTLTRREGTGVILFRKGQVIYAASDSVRDTLGNILVCNKLITESTLMAALEAQHKSPEGKLLGAILVEKGYITKEILEKSIREQIEKVIHEFFTWQQGFFKFELMEFEGADGLAVDTRDFLLKAGLSPDYLVLEAGRRRDEGEGRQTVAAPGAGRGAAGGPAPPGPPPAGTNNVQAGRGDDRPTPELGGAAGADGGLHKLRSIMKEIRSPNFTGEITLMIMRYAAEIVDRGIFFVMKSDGISGMGQFGLGQHGQEADERVRQIKIPLDQASVFTEVLDKRQTYLGPPTKSYWNDRLMESLASLTPKVTTRVPTAVLAVPMTVNDTVVAILYGDNAVTGRPIGEIEALELLMNQAGLAMEKALLELKIKNFESRLATTAPR